jgi:predicted regulator of Ras-like GTPase activity (Roadblock/LC7/MglB family)
MLSDVPPTQAQDLTWLLSGLLQKVPLTHSALLTSADGLPRAAHGIDAVGADHLAALASGLFSLARNVGVLVGETEGVRQVVAELDNTLLFVAAAGPGTVLAVLAGRGADAGVLGYEMAQLVKSVRPYLATPFRGMAGFSDDAPR